MAGILSGGSGRGQNLSLGSRTGLFRGGGIIRGGGGFGRAPRQNMVGKLKGPRPMRAPRPPRAPGGLGAAANPANPAGPGATQAASPLDSTYFANTAANQFGVNNKINALNLQNSTNSTALQSALAQLAYQQPRAELQLEQKANAGGGLYSSVYGQNLGNLNYQFMGRQGAAIDSFAAKASQIASQIAALRGSEPLYNAQQYALAAQRASLAAQKNPASGEAMGPLGGTRSALARAIASKPHVNAKGGGKRAPNRNFERPHPGHERIGRPPRVKGAGTRVHAGPARRGYPGPGVVV